MDIGRNLIKFAFGVVFCAAVLWLAGCEQNSNVSNTQTTVSNSNSTPANGNTNTTTAPTTTADIEGTPAAIVKGYHLAILTRDPEEMKKYLSKDALTWLEAKAKKNKMSLNEYLKGTTEDVKENKNIQFINKSSNDKTALVCVRDNTAQDQSIFADRLVRENGEWKFELHKTLEYLELTDEAREAMIQGKNEKSGQAFKKAMNLLGSNTCP